MPDFDARFTGGTTLQTWTDPPLDQRPTRINPFALHPHRYRRSEVGEEIQITVTCQTHPVHNPNINAGIVEGPPDNALGGRTFLGWFAECPSRPGPGVTSPPGQSSVRHFTPTEFGHYTYVLRRMSGGGIILHVDVVDP